jgi:hypothetical protein
LILLYSIAFKSINTADRYQYVNIGEVNFQFGSCTNKKRKEEKREKKRRGEKKKRKKKEKRREKEKKRERKKEKKRGEKREEDEHKLYPSFLKIDFSF